MLLVLSLTACGFQNQSFDMQGKAGDIGDAMEHCRKFMTYLIPENAYVYIDEASSRETEEYYDIFLDIHDDKESGYGQCRVDKKGMIIYHVIREFRQQGRSFN